MASNGSRLTLTGVAEGTATITVTARDSDGNTVSDTFAAPVAKRYAGLIARIREYRNDPRYVNDQAHTNRWDRALLSFGETVADQTLTAMSADGSPGLRRPGLDPLGGGGPGAQGNRGQRAGNAQPRPHRVHRHRRR